MDKFKKFGRSILDLMIFTVSMCVYFFYAALMVCGLILYVPIAFIKPILKRLKRFINHLKNVEVD